MPELPEVEVLARHLRPLVRGKTIRAIEIRRPKVVNPTPTATLRKQLSGSKIIDLSRRGKYLLFAIRPKESKKSVLLLGHLGMTGRMFLQSNTVPLPKHAAVILDLGKTHFVYEDTRYFGRFTLDSSSVEKLGPEPWDERLTAETLQRELRKSRQPIKVKLLDQTLLAGVGNIYASEALFRAGISPRRAAHKITLPQAEHLLASVREVLSQAIDGGSTIPLNFGAGKSDGLFYFGRQLGVQDFYAERLRVYDRAGKPCAKCNTSIKRIVQAARSTYYCPTCQKS